KANETSAAVLPRAASPATNSAPAEAPSPAPLTLAFVDLPPHIVSGRSASRSLASLGRLKDGITWLAPAVDGSVLGAGTLGGATDAAVEGAAATLGFGDAAPPQPQRTMTRALDAIATTARRAIGSLPECVRTGQVRRRRAESSGLRAECCSEARRRMRS